MSAQALSDDQVRKELKKMTEFILQEAKEKAHEIHFKADEEFAKEKSKLVRQETASIDTEYEKKFKQASMSQQITRSTQSNKTRLRILVARQELLDNLFDEAQKHIQEKTAKGDKYDEILKGLILESLYMLGEQKLSVRCREADKDKVEKAAKQAADEYKKELETETELKIDEKNWLPKDSAGGVFITGSNGKVELDNTFEARLKMCKTDALPSVRATLFGENENRKFHD